MKRACIARHLRQIVATAGLGLLPIACTTVHYARVDAINNPESKGGHSFRIVSDHPHSVSGQSDYPEAEALVKTALSGKGMYEAPNPGEAEVEVEIDFGIGPKRTYVFTPPSVQSSSPMADEAMRTRSGQSLRNRNLGRPFDDEFDPSRRRMPQEDDPIVRHAYEKFVVLVARKAVPGPDGEMQIVELWRVSVIIEDPKDEIVSYLPVLVAAALDHIDTNTGSARTVRISNKDKAVEFVKRDPT